MERVPGSTARCITNDGDLGKCPHGQDEALRGAEGAAVGQKCDGIGVPEASEPIGNPQLGTTANRVQIVEGLMNALHSSRPAPDGNKPVETPTITNHDPNPILRQIRRKPVGSQHSAPTLHPLTRRPNRPSAFRPLTHRRPIYRPVGRYFLGNFATTVYTGSTMLATLLSANCPNNWYASQRPKP